MDEQTLLLKKITTIFLGTHDFQQLARQAVDLIVSELNKQGVVTAAIGRMHEKDNVIYAYAYSNKYRRLIDKLLPRKFSDLNVSLDRTDNLAVRTVVANQIQQSKRVADYSRGMLPDSLTDKIQSIMKGKLCISFPIRTRSGKAAGVLLLLLKDEKMTGQQLVLFETIADQLGLAFSNVMAFEKLVEKYQQTLQKDLTSLNTEDIPSIKFTLRITPKQDRNLSRLGREKGMTKAELIRDRLDGLLSSS